ncbi:uncharacterized protein [Euwallacea fornicatus]|uniref:uncharacterized protein n=1 Tax=Euwallacea fornicatus TaxID=995702 RepID=UPI00338DE553
MSSSNYNKRFLPSSHDLSVGVNMISDLRIAFVTNLDLCHIIFSMLFSVLLIIFHKIWQYRSNVARKRRQAEAHHRQNAQEYQRERRRVIRSVNERIANLTASQAQPDDNGIYNISSRVQGQQPQYPDGYLSVDHITISNELNKPPKYDDAPPTYEEAVKLAMAHSNSIQTFQAEQVNNTRPQPHSSTSSTPTTVVVPAVASQSTE